MTPAEFLSECQRRGVRLSTDGEKIKASGNPPSKPDAFTAYLKRYKGEIISLLAPSLSAAADHSETGGEVGGNWGQEAAPANASDTFRQSPPEQESELSPELLALGRSIDLEQEISALAEVLELALDLERFGVYAPVNIIGGNISSPGKWLRSAAWRIERIASRVLAEDAPSLQALASLEQSLAGEAGKIREVICQICTPVHRAERPAPC